MTFIFGRFRPHCKSEQKQVNETKSNGICAYLIVFFLIYQLLQHIKTFEMCFLIRSILQKRDPEEKYPYLIYSINVKGN